MYVNIDKAVYITIQILWFRSLLIVSTYIVNFSPLELIFILKIVIALEKKCFFSVHNWILLELRNF